MTPGALDEVAFDLWSKEPDPTEFLWFETVLPIAERDPLAVEVPLLCYGGTYCSCSAPRTTMGCGGCCADLGGCMAEYERSETAPHLWNGDSA
jgi:hypothetical protein